MRAKQFTQAALGARSNEKILNTNRAGAMQTPQRRCEAASEALSRYLVLSGKGGIPGSSFGHDFSSSFI